MIEELVGQLKNTLLFHDIPDEALTAVAHKAAVRDLAVGDVLIRRGEVGDSMFVINEGWFKIVAEDDQGNELIINETGPGETIGEMALLDEAPRSAMVIALVPAKVLELKKDAFLETLNQRPDMAMMLIRSLSARLRFSTTYIQKAIGWSQKIAEGDYSFIEQAQPAEGVAGVAEDKAAQLLSAFFKMVRSVRAREDDLKQQLEMLTLEIDEARRKREFAELTSTDFYANLKEQARKLREQRRAGQNEE